MTDIIYKMRGDLREILHQSVVDYPSKAREKWIFDWPSQIILVVNQIFWCQEVEEAFINLNKGKSSALKVHSCKQLWYRVSNTTLCQIGSAVHFSAASDHSLLHLQCVPIDTHVHASVITFISSHKQ